MPTLQEANEYHSKRLTSDAWFAAAEEKREQALQSAADLLRRIVKEVSAFSLAVICEQAAYMLTTDFNARLNKYKSLGMDGSSIAYHWDDAKDLLAPLVADEFEEEKSSSNRCKFGRMR